MIEMKNLYLLRVEMNTFRGAESNSRIFIFNLLRSSLLIGELKAKFCNILWHPIKKMLLADLSDANIVDHFFAKPLHKSSLIFSFL